MLLRRATVGDALEITRVTIAGWRRAYRGIFADEFLDGFDEQEKATQRAEQLGSPAASTFVVEDRGRLLGYANLVPSRDEDCAPNTGELAGLYVDPDLKGRGIGRRLFEAATAEARRCGYDAMTLWVLSENVGARAFYGAAGCRPDGTEVEERRMPLAPGRGRPTELRYLLALPLGPLQVRPARSDDVDGMAELDLRAWRAAYGGLVAPEHLAGLRPGPVADKLRAQLPDAGRWCAVAERGDELLGFGRVKWDAEGPPGVVELAGLAVDPQFQGGGAGRALVEACATEARWRGAGVLVLWVLEHNAGARAFYERLGWRFDGTLVEEPRVPGVEPGTPTRKARYQLAL